MRTVEQLKAEIEIRKQLGLPRIELTPEERARAFGDVDYSNRDRDARLKTMVVRYNNGLSLSKSDIKEVKKYLKQASNTI
jgi:hypothetical protein